MNLDSYKFDPIKPIIKTLVFVSMLSVLQKPVHAKHNFGAGFVLGDPTGITVKYEMSSKRAVDGALSLLRNNEMYLHSTRLWLKPKVFNIDRHPVFWYFGFGARLRSYDHRDKDDSLRLGARGVSGLRMKFRDPRIEVFGELSLTMDLIPDMDTDFGIGVGGRYYF